MNLETARQLATEFLDDMQAESEIELAFNLDITEEHPLGYVFFYNAKRYWATRDFMDSLAGNGPILVRRDNGEVSVLPSNQSVERSLSELSAC